MLYNKEKGQIILETIIVFPIIIFLVYFCIESIRLSTFKNVLLITANSIALQISEQQILLSKYSANFDSCVNNINDCNSLNKLRHSLEYSLEQHLKQINTFNASVEVTNSKGVIIYDEAQNFYRIYISYKKENSLNGVATEIYACVPLLFAKSNKYLATKLNDNGKIKRNCLGEIYLHKDESTLDLLASGYIKIKVQGYSLISPNYKIFSSGFISIENDVTSAPNDLIGYESISKNIKKYIVQEINK